MTRVPPPRGDETRKKLVEAGVRLFATLGYNAVSTREIARAAGVNPAAIGFHFKGKQGLYEVVIATMVEKFQGLSAPMVAVIEANIDACAGDRQRLRQITHQAVEQFLTASMATQRSRWLGFLLQREYADPTEVFETIDKELIKPVLTAIQRLVEAADPGATPQLKQVRVCCIMSQLTNQSGNLAIFRRNFGHALSKPEMLSNLVSVLTDSVCGLLGL